MVTSMTGFGRGTAAVGGSTATIELRSVNNRFCETSVRLPRAIAEREPELHALLRSAFDRGRITAQVQIEQTAEEALPLRINAEAARAYTLLLERLRDAAGIDAPIRIEHLLTFSEIFKPADEAPAAAEHAWKAVQQALTGAIAGMKEMRLQEGRALQADLSQRVDAIERELEAVARRAPERVHETRVRLHERLAELIGDERINPERLELEVALLADRLDVTEECVRLRSHIQVFREALDSRDPVGRKLNFLVQEMNREVNTIGSKANDSEVAHRAVQMKEELEKIREQVQNVE